MILRDQDGQRSKRHVFPIPECKAFPHGGLLNQGATCCVKHYPKIKRLQIEQGLLIEGKP